MEACRLQRMPEPLHVRHFVRHDEVNSDEYRLVVSKRQQLFEATSSADVLMALEQDASKPDLSSSAAQAKLLPALEELGFRDEAGDLFKGFPVENLRPDYYCALPTPGSGVLVEVERGKTVRNNMDLLDLWKTHLCPVAHHLWLFVPRTTLTQLGTVRERPFRPVVERIGSFFREERTQIDVRSVSVFGYGPIVPYVRPPAIFRQKWLDDQTIVLGDVR